MTAAESVARYRHEKTTRLYGHIFGWLFVAGCTLGAWGIWDNAAIPPQPVDDGSGIAEGSDWPTGSGTMARVVYGADTGDAGPDTAPAGWTWVDDHWVDGSGYVVETGEVSP